jgi:hypothetical protein
VPGFSIAMRIQNGGGSAILLAAATVIKQIEAAMKAKLAEGAEAMPAMGDDARGRVTEHPDPYPRPSAISSLSCAARRSSSAICRRLAAAPLSRSYFSLAMRSSKGLCRFSSPTRPPALRRKHGVVVEHDGRKSIICAVGELPEMTKGARPSGERPSDPDDYEREIEHHRYKQSSVEDYCDGQRPLEQAIKRLGKQKSAA